MFDFFKDKSGGDYSPPFTAFGESTLDPFVAPNDSETESNSLQYVTRSIGLIRPDDATYRGDPFTVEVDANGNPIAPATQPAV